MNNKLLYNNLGIASLSIAFIVSRAGSISLSKALLILPIITHKELLAYLSNSKTQIHGMERLIIEKIHCFSNFNKRYYDNLITSINAIQLLNEIELIQTRDHNLSAKSILNYEDLMGGRAKKIHKAANNIITILNDSAEKLYLNLRVEL